MSDTPRTDVAEIIDDPNVDVDYVYSEFARHLERELTEANAKVAALEAEVARLTKAMHEAADDIRSIFGG